MTRKRYIETFNNWCQLNENSGQEDEIIERVDGLTRDFKEAASRGKLETSDLMIWFHGIMNLYDNSELKGLIFKKMKPVWSTYFNQIYPLLNVDNRELTKHDVMEIKRYKQLTADEVRYAKSADDMLRDLGLI